MGESDWERQWNEDWDDDWDAINDWDDWAAPPWLQEFLQLFDELPDMRARP